VLALLLAESGAIRANVNPAPGKPQTKIEAAAAGKAGGAAGTDPADFSVPEPEVLLLVGGGLLLLSFVRRKRREE